MLAFRILRLTRPLSFDERPCGDEVEQARECACLDCTIQALLSLTEKSVRAGDGNEYVIVNAKRELAVRLAGVVVAKVGGEERKSGIPTPSAN